MNNYHIPRHILPVIVFAQFAGTSVWFAGNAVSLDLISRFGYPDTATGFLTSSVQFGFIAGTLLFAFFSLADRMSPTLLFMLCSIFSAIVNVASLWMGENLTGMIIIRFITGFFLAGIYPVGMKIASDWYRGKLGLALGFLVGALVLGTSLPHLLQFTNSNLSWKFTFIMTSVMSVLGGLLLFFTVGDGPNRIRNVGFDAGIIRKIFREREFRAAAFGYFGHMWELYAFWAFLPLLITEYNQQHHASLPVSLLSFLLIAAGFISCSVGGWLSVKWGSYNVARYSLILSGICCLLSIWMEQFPVELFITFLTIWSLTVISDSPQFSTLVATRAPSENRGTALTLVNSLGFLITAGSIELLNFLQIHFSVSNLVVLLALGPIFGIIGLGKWSSR